jgi:hypothetical protein
MNSTILGTLKLNIIGDASCTTMANLSEKEQLSKAAQVGIATLVNVSKDIVLASIGTGRVAALLTAAEAPRSLLRREAAQNGASSHGSSLLSPASLEESTYEILRFPENCTVDSTFVIFLPRSHELAVKTIARLNGSRIDELSSLINAGLFQTEFSDRKQIEAMALANLRLQTNSASELALDEPIEIR